MEWETVENKPKDIRNITDDLIAEARKAVEDGMVRKAPESKEVQAAVKAAGRWVREFVPGKSVRSRTRDGVVHWWVANKVVRKPKEEGAQKPDPKKQNGQPASALQRAASAVRG